MALDRNKLVAFVQRELNARYGASLTVDGLIGRNTINALARVSALPTTWPTARRMVGLVQYISHLEPNVDDIAIDGKWGPNTEYTFSVLEELSNTGRIDNWRDENEVESKYDWPRYRDCTRFFGEPTTNQSKVVVPYRLKLAWDLDRSLTRFTCHEKVVEPIQEAMEEILDFYTLDGIKELKLDLWGGCLNNRKMRGGSKPSTHSWGIAIDWNPAENRLRWKSDRATLAQPVYNEFWNAWERVGAVSLGRAKGYDWMHLQFCRP